MDGTGRRSMDLPYAIVAASAVIDFQAAVVDGWMPVSVRARLVAAMGEALQKYRRRGVARSAGA